MKAARDLDAPASDNSASAFIDNLACGPLDYLEVEELAAALKKSPQTIRNWVARREIPYIRLGRRTIFSRESVREWLRKKEVTSNGS